MIKQRSVFLISVLLISILLSEAGECAISKHSKEEFIPSADSRMATGKHPRIWLGENDLTTLRRNCLDGVKNEQWLRFKRYVDKFTKGGDIAITGSALCYLVLKDSDKDAAQTYAKKAIQAMLTHPQINNESYLIRSRVSESMAIGYDWCFDAMSENERRDIASRVAELAKKLNSMGKANVSTLHNYELTSISAVGIAAIAIYGDNPEGKDIFDAVTDKYADVLNIYDYMKDGGWYEGTDYNRLSSLPSIKFFSALSKAADVNLFKTSPFLINHSYYLIYTLKPDRTFYRGADVLYPAVDDSHRAMLLILASETKNGYAQWFYENTFAASGKDYPFSHSPDLIYHLIWYDPQLKPILPANEKNPLPLSKYFSDIGLAIMRSTWKGDATWISFQNHDWFSSHHHADNNAFEIFKNGSLAIDSGGLAMMRVGTKYYNAYYSRTVAHNTVIIKDPSEKWRGGLSIVNDGGQRVPRLHVLKNFAEWRKAYEDTDYSGGGRITSVHLADWKRYENDDTSYTYISSDTTKSYSSNKIKHLAREFVYFRPDCIIILDRVRSKNKKYQKSWLLHSIESPVIFKFGSLEASKPLPGIHNFGNVDLVKIDDKRGRLFCKTLLPEKSIVTTVGGPGYEFFVDGKNWTLDQAFMPGTEPGSWRIEISPAIAQESDLFLNVLYTGNISEDAMPHTVIIKSEDANMIGAYIKNRVVLFSKTGADERVARYMIDCDGKAQHLLCDFEPSKGYTITINGEFFKKLASSKEGTLYFNTDGTGKQNISIK